MAEAQSKQINKLTKTNFLTVYPEFLHRFSHMNLVLQDYIIADKKLESLYVQREEKGPLDLAFNKKNDELVEDQVNYLIDKFNDQ